MRILLRIIWELRLYNPFNFVRFVFYYFTTGANLILLARYSAFRNKDKICLVDDNREISHNDFFNDCIRYQIFLSQEQNMVIGKKVAIISKNSIEEIQILFAISATGSDLFLLNADLSKEQLLSIHRKYCFDFILTDKEVYQSMATDLKQLHSAVIFNLENLKSELSKPKFPLSKFKGKKSGAIIVLTGGTTGVPKLAKRKPSVFTFLSPVYVLLKDVGVNKFQTILTPLPIYHGFGLATVITSVLFGKMLVITKKFEVKLISELIKNQKVELAVFVPVMIKKLLEYSKDNFYILDSVITGGASISSDLVQDIANLNGAKLYNLYGTSEAGFCLLATHSDLKLNPATVGRPIKGVEIMIEKKSEIETYGEILIRSKWTINKSNWIHTGDLGFTDGNGYFFLKGRKDNMIVSGGENVYPEDVEKILLLNEFVIEVAVFGIPDSEFGQVLKAFIIMKENSELNPELLRIWLKDKVARFQMPKEIVFCSELPYTSIGKLDKRKLD